MINLLIRVLKKLEYILIKVNKKRHFLVKIISMNKNVAKVKALGFIWKLDITRYLDRGILENGVFEPYSTALVKDLIKPGMVVADIGANFGYYTLQFGRLVGKSGYVYAFEPVDRYRIRLLEHLKMNNIINVEVIDKALSNKQGKAKISVGECSGTFHWCSQQKPEEVREVLITTLDTFVEERKIRKLDFLKVDLDGHEPMFLEGAQNTLNNFRPIILTEISQESLYAAGSTAWDFVNKLEHFGYILVSTKNRKVFSSHLECLKEVANFSHSVNVLCVPLENKLLNNFKDI